MSVIFTVASFVPPIITLIYSILTKQNDVIFNSILTMFCIAAIIVMRKKTSVFTNVAYHACIIFTLLSIFIGRTLKAYNIITHWDKVLHFASGFIILAIGKQVYSAIKGNTENRTLMNWFAMLFSVAAAAVWEFYEFFVDSFLHMTAQLGLKDTMLDMIAGTVSALIALAISEIKHKYEKNHS